MSDNSGERPEVDSGVLPAMGQMGAFRCGNCWSSLVVVQGQVVQGKVRVRLACPYCGNQTEEVEVVLEEVSA